MFFFILSVACLVWLHIVARKMMKAKAPELLRDLEEGEGSTSFSLIGEEK